MTSNCTGGTARCIQQHSIESAATASTRWHRPVSFRRRVGSGAVLPQARDTVRITLKRGDAGTSGGKLRRLTPWRSTQVGHSLARLNVQQTRRQSGGGVLHPEQSSLEAGNSVTLVPGGKRTDPVGRVATVGHRRIGPQRDIQRGLVLVRERDGARIRRPRRPRATRACPASDRRDPPMQRHRLQRHVAAPHSPDRRTAPGRARVPAPRRLRPRRGSGCPATADLPRRCEAHGAPARAAPCETAAPARRPMCPSGAAPRRQADEQRPGPWPRGLAARRAPPQGDGGDPVPH